MPPELLYIGCGLFAGVVAGYLGLGGGVIMVPFLTVVMGVDIKVAAPVSIGAIVVTSLASSNEYIKRDMVDMELTILIGLFMTIGSVVGSALIDEIPSAALRFTLALIIFYAAISMVRGRKNMGESVVGHRTRNYYLFCGLFALVAGFVAAVVGIGGGLLLVPIMYLLLGVPMTVARGTSLLLMGFSSAAATAVYFANGRIDYAILAPIVVGIIFGGRLGGLLGTISRPLYVRLAFAALMFYLGIRLIYEPLTELL